MFISKPSSLQNLRNLNRIVLITLLSVLIQESLCANNYTSIESGDRCITRDELIKIQKNTLEANLSFFKKLKWDYLEGSDESFEDYF
jgi:hypothetical protein